MSNRVWSDVAKRMVPGHDAAAVAAYEASPRAYAERWLAFERDYWAMQDEV